MTRLQTAVRFTIPDCPPACSCRGTLPDDDWTVVTDLMVERACAADFVNTVQAVAELCRILQR